MDLVTVVIPTKDAGEQFRQTLSAISSQRTDHEVEVLVIDSGSDDGTVALAREFGAEVIEIETDEFHHARTRNLGARRADGDVVVFTVQDAVPLNDNWLASLVAPLRDPDVAAVYGRQIAYPDAKPMDEFFYSYMYPNERRELTAADTADPRQFYLDHVYISSVSVAFDRDVWAELEFRPDISMSEDKDFALRALERGHRLVYEPGSEIRHSHDYSLWSLFERRYQDGRAFADIAREGNDTFVSSGLRYVREEIGYLFRSGNSHWIPYALVYDLVHFLSFQIGKLHGRVAAGGPADKQL